LEEPNPFDGYVGIQGPAGQLGQVDDEGFEDDAQPIPVVGPAVPAAAAAAPVVVQPVPVSASVAVVQQPSAAVVAHGPIAPLPPALDAQGRFASVAAAGVPQPAIDPQPAVIAPLAGFANPGFGYPPVPMANAVHAGEVFIQATAAVGMILHPWVAQLARDGNLPLYDVNSTGAALQHRIEFTRHRDEVLGPVPPQCCEYYQMDWR
jgi:hypothetical protein